MIVAVLSNKGGVGKTTTAIHLAAYFHRQAPTALIDGDYNRSSLKWAQRGDLPFNVFEERDLAYARAEHDHLIIDTQAYTEDEDLRTLAQACDLLVIPSTPDMLALDGLIGTVGRLRRLGASNYRVLLTRMPPPQVRDGQDARQSLIDMEYQLFSMSIPRLICFERAALAGVPVYEVKDPRAAIGWASYLGVGDEIQRTHGAKEIAR